MKPEKSTRINKKRRIMDEISGFSSILGADAIVRGVYEAKDNSAVYGRIEGDCEVRGALVFGETAHCTGSIVADRIIVGGRVDGDVIAQHKIEILAEARINGNIIAPVIAIAQGAIIKGDIRMSTKHQPIPFEEKRASRLAAPTPRPAGQS